MNCLSCDMPTGVVDSRPREDGAIRRRRRCLSCGERFTTFEQVAYDGEAEDAPGRHIACTLTALAKHLRSMDAETVAALTTIARTLARAGGQPEIVEKAA